MRVCKVFDRDLPLQVLRPMRMLPEDMVGRCGDKEPHEMTIDFSDFPDHRCPHLEGKVGKHVRCKVYVDRPGVCRAFLPGTYVCMALRYHRGLEPIHPVWKDLEREERVFGAFPV